MTQVENPWAAITEQFGQVSANAHNAAIRALIDEQIEGRAYVAQTVARDIVADLRAHDPELLAAWLDAQAERLLTEVIRRIDQGGRSGLKERTSRSVFAGAARAHAEGDPAPLADWLDTHWTLPSGVRTPLKLMTRGDLLDVGNAYEERADQNRMTATFMRALAAKLKPGQQVSDVYSDEQVATMWRSLNGKASKQ